MRAQIRRRSCLTVPGGSEKMLRKAVEIDADEIVLDLEDGVAPGAKDGARRLVVEFIASGIFRSRQLAVRVNAIGSPWCHQDIIAVAGLNPLTLVLPKVESAGDLAFADRLLAGLEAGQPPLKPMGIQALIETAAGLQRVDEIAGASTRLEALIIGYGDLASSLGRTAVSNGEANAWSFVRERLLLAARTHGLQAIDGPNFLLTSGEAHLAAEAAHAAALGFDGKWAIHPSQITPINSAFTPDDAAVQRARGILAQLDAAHVAGNGIAQFEGAMIDEAMRLGAERVLARSGQER